MFNRNRNNGVIKNGDGDVVITDTVIGEPEPVELAEPGTNNGVISIGRGNVVITGSTLGTGNTNIKH